MTHADLQLASPLPGGERSDRACAIRVRGNPVPTSEFRPPSPGMAARSATIPTSPLRGEVKSGCVSFVVKCSKPVAPGVDDQPCHHPQAGRPASYRGGEIIEWKVVAPTRRSWPS